MNPLIIFGAGGHGKCIINAALLSRECPALVIDDAPKCAELLGVPVVRSYCPKQGFRFVVAIGHSETRREKFDLLVSYGGLPATIIHPAASVADGSEIGDGTVVLSGATIDPSVTVGENCIVNVGAIIGHDCTVGNDCHISGNASVCGGVTIGEGVWVGVGAIIKEGVTIGDGAYIAMGALVTHDIPPHHKAISPHRKEAMILPI
jgi:sugar O-acyltransferase (sialic acid O-acetyltransferase NeuD family)